MKLKLFAIVFLLSIGFASALSVDNVHVSPVGPGEEGIISIWLSNDGDDTVKDVSLNIDFLQEIVPIGSSEGFIDEIKEDEEEEFAFKFKVSNTLLPGTYTLAYEIKYEEDGDDKTQKGDLGIVIFAQPEVQVTVDAQNPVMGNSGNINL